MDTLRIITGSSHPWFAQDIAKKCGTELCNVDHIRFANDNMFVQIEENVRAADVFIIQTPRPSVSDHLLEMLMLVQACRSASAERITVVMPYFFYARSDKKDQPRIPITARLVADMIEAAGADRVLCMNLHSQQVQGFFRIPIDQIFATEHLCKAIRPFIEHDSWTVVSPDLGGAKLAKMYSEILKLPLAMMTKNRPGNYEEPEVGYLTGDVHGRSVLIVDDEIASGGTFVKAAKWLHDEAGAKAVYGAVIHPVLGGNAVKRLAAAPIERLWMTDTFPVPYTAPNMEVVSVTDIFADAIMRIHQNISVSQMFKIKRF